MSKRVLICVVSVLAFLAVATRGKAEQFQIPLPGLIGSYSFGRTSTNFDFGTPFQSIQEARLRLVGTLTPGLGHGDGVEMPADHWFPWPGEFELTMDPGPGLWYAFVGDNDLGTEQPFSGLGNPTWDFLLDGEGEISCGIVGMIFIGGVMVNPPSGSISEAYLIIEGTVPEPTTLSLLAFGILALFRYRRS